MRMVANQNTCKPKIRQIILPILPTIVPRNFRLPKPQLHPWTVHEIFGGKTMDQRATRGLFPTAGLNFATQRSEASTPSVAESTWQLAHDRGSGWPALRGPLPHCLHLPALDDRCCTTTQRFDNTWGEWWIHRDVSQKMWNPYNSPSICLHARYYDNCGRTVLIMNCRKVPAFAHVAEKSNIPVIAIYKHLICKQTIETGCWSHLCSV